MPYEPKEETAALLDQALGYVQGVQYNVTARWVFYRLLQDGYLDKKGDYKRLLGLLSKARKGFVNGWRPDTLVDDSRATDVRGSGFRDGHGWLRAVARQVTCNLDRWADQPAYVEVWFEAAAMMQQFAFYTNENVPLLAFHGDVSIPAKWDAAVRLVSRYRQLRTPIKVLYFGDLDPKGLQIPNSARDDVMSFAGDVYREAGGAVSDYADFLDDFEFIRVGLNDDHVDLYSIPENPERPGTYQWEGLDDTAAQEMIREVERHLDGDAFAAVMTQEDDITSQYRVHVEALTLQ